MNWMTMVGDREENDILIGIHIVNHNVTLGVNTNTRRFSTGSGTDGNIYRLDLNTGIVLPVGTGFGATVYHSALAMYSFYQVRLPLN